PHLDSLLPLSYVPRSTLIYAPSPHAALPISDAFAGTAAARAAPRTFAAGPPARRRRTGLPETGLSQRLSWHPRDMAELAIPGFLDRKSTRLNPSHVKISYAGFRLQRKHRHVR